MTNIDALKSEAAQLGIDVDGRWSEARIQAEIETKKAELAKADKDANLGEQVKADQAEKPDPEANANNAGEVDLKARIAELEAQIESAKHIDDSDTAISGDNVIVKNTSKNPTWVTATKRCGVGESVIVSDAEFQASRKSIENAVKHGLLEVVE